MLNASLKCYSDAADHSLHDRYFDNHYQMSVDTPSIVLHNIPFVSNKRANYRRNENSTVDHENAFSIKLWQIYDRPEMNEVADMEVRLMASTRHLS